LLAPRPAPELTSLPCLLLQRPPGEHPRQTLAIRTVGVGIPDRNGKLTKQFVAVRFPELARYQAADDAATARAQAREYVAASIAGQHARVVIAHSLGTILAYEALHTHPELGVDLLVNLPSPLARRRRPTGRH
jgi:pimeloyl-ACP methyl ester carboxylesterase